ncbi:inositol monophosphatase family protein [Parvularcula lutaonensis]|uniref:Inositol monophosphatase family protein n=1 Tax=Parvularcula lutaonensis TaxID=491923 RepID=A0ABV7M9C0_9PROT|nr:inositol monophosphatase [Parvularcula lutaonensis]GGY41766.1 inositol phosphatase [Parvularcula lutaonensis]
MSDPKLDEVEALLRDVADRVILPRFRSLSDGDIEEKNGPGDLVTIADREAEELLTPAFKKLAPGSTVVGEEAVSQGKISIDALHSEGDLWLVDPVDGTWNFVQGSERFGVMCAFIRNREVVKSWILFPVDGRCMVAEKGAGATFGGERLGLHPAKPWAEARGDFSPVYVDEPYRSAFAQAVEESAGARAGHCSAYAYGDLARGLIDYVVQYKMTPWDHAPGQLLVEEAGGRFGFLPGGEPYTPVGRGDRPMLGTASAEAWQGYADRLMAAT